MLQAYQPTYMWAQYEQSIQHIYGLATSGPANSHKIYVCSKCASQHICGLATSDPADSNKIYVHSMHASQHICGPTMSDPANRDKIYALHACQLIYMWACYEQSSQQP